MACHLDPFQSGFLISFGSRFALIDGRGWKQNIDNEYMQMQPWAFLGNYQLSMPSMMTTVLKVCRVVGRAAMCENHVLEEALLAHPNPLTQNCNYSGANGAPAPGSVLKGLALFLDSAKHRMPLEQHQCDLLQLLTHLMDWVDVHFKAT